MMANVITTLKNTLFLPLRILQPVWNLLIWPFRRLSQWIFAYANGSCIPWVNSVTGKEKAKLFEALEVLKRGKPNLTLVELGAGGGANLKYYPQGTNLYAVEPNDCSLPHLKKNLADFPHVNLKRFLISRAEDMREIEDNFCDAVVCTYVLCSVDDIGQILKETKRILRPGGMFLYMEHIAAPRSTWFYTFQCLLTPLWRPLFEGCELNRESWRPIDNAGFCNVEYEKYQSKSKFLPMRHLLSGTATKSKHDDIS